MKYSLRTLSSIFASLIFGCGFFFWHVWFNHEQVTSESSITARKRQPLSILLVNTEKEGFGGREIHTLACYRMLKNYGHKPLLLITKDSRLEAAAKRLKLPYYAVYAPRLWGKNRFFTIYFHVASLYLQNVISLIQCDVERDLGALKKIAARFNIPLIFMQHRAEEPPMRALAKLQHVDALIGVSTKIAAYFETRKKELDITHVRFIPPCFAYKEFDAPRLVDTTRHEYFATTFGLSIPEMPLFVISARLEKDKNIGCALKAFSFLIHTKKKQAQLVIAGMGNRLAKLQAQIQKYHLTLYVHLVGYVEQPVQLFTHSDALIMPSKEEAFGLVALEGALMSKPVLGARGSGAQESIIDTVTGLLYTPNDYEDLAQKIAWIIDHPVQACTMGHAARKHVHQNFSPEALMKQYNDFYDTILINNRLRELH